ncbi:uncharacterized protein M421DRAFT_7132 [Didymella exigua CBS 183.55]|uniref:Uncharacterized protein n=1 Tax=Didymella exigua CBS 183.55 TaxID=1150837 RepID=A0A6A5RET4_9PLEO|nr:uncharacterized protein M421DRAFT_7132 [Didymella exigua CBS 183.55]KAF1926192.1 hypothetical protein M421DRAFT_7132 [Didymella exigua CBS 183.55]
MRYDNWDVILFPDDSNIPIPEYRTACYLSRDEDGHELPTLRTYIGSLKPEAPFRISLHHWGPPKPSSFVQELQRRAGKKSTFTVQVIIGGVRLYHGSFELNNTSPQDIAFEQRSFKSSRTKEQPTSQTKKRLLFPPNDKSALLQNSAWQPRGTDNRIKIVLSEQLVSGYDLLDDGTWDIVCFSFQHAPRELLEQAGIAYPIIDPLRALMAERATAAAQSFPRNPMARELQRGPRIHSGNSPESDSEPIRPANPEPHQQPPDRMPSLPQYSQPFMGHQGGHPTIWYNTYGTSGEPDDGMRLRSFPSQRYTSNTSGLEGFYDPSFPSYAAPLWASSTALSGHFMNPVVNSRRPWKDNNAQQVMMALRDEQFGQILEAISPSKAERSKPNDLPAQNQSHRPPKMGALSVPVRPSSAAMLRTFPDVNASSRNRRPSSGQANFDMTAPVRHHTNKKENHGPRMHTPVPFMLAPQRWDSDVSMRDGSSNASGLSRAETFPRGVSSKIGCAHAPSAINQVKSRKEGLVNDTNDLELDIRHDQSLLPIVNNSKTVSGDLDRTPRNNHVEVIDVDTIDPTFTANLAKLSPFKPSHKAGMSSVSSTGRLERQLYSALGEELGSFEQMDANEMGPELAKALSGDSQSDLSGSTALDATIDFEPMTKRKRQGTLGGEREKSPAKKKERARQAMVENEEEHLPDEMQRLRGD